MMFSLFVRSLFLRIVLLLLKRPFITTLVKIIIKLVWLVSSWFIPNYRTPVFMYDILRWQLVFILYCFLVSSGPDVKSVYHLTGNSYVFWVAFLLQLSRFSLVFTSLFLTCQWSSLWVLIQYKFILINIHWASWVIIFMFCIIFEKFRSFFSNIVSTLFSLFGMINGIIGSLELSTLYSVLQT